jgi:hypothetical protein
VLQVCTFQRPTTLPYVERSQGQPMIHLDLVDLQDPENILAPPQAGHIQRRSFQKKYVDEAEREAAMIQAAEQERIKARAAREVNTLTSVS